MGSLENNLKILNRVTKEDLNVFQLINFRCRGSPGEEWCECQSGWGGKGCIKPTQSASLQQQSYLTWALSFSPVSISTNLQLRFVYL